MEGGKEQNFWPGFVDALSNVVLVMIFVVVVFVVTLFYYSQKLAEYKAHKFVEKKDTPELIQHPATAGARDEANSVPGIASKPQSAQQTVNKAEQQPPATPVVPTVTVAAPASPAVDAAKDKQIAKLKEQVARLQVQLASQSNTAVPGSTRTDISPNNRIIEVKPKEARQAETGVALQSTGEALVLQFDEQATLLDPTAVKGLDSGVAAWVDKVKSGTGKIIVSGAVGRLGFTEGRRRAYYRAAAIRNRLIELGVPPARVISRVVPGEDTVESGRQVIVQYSAQDIK